MLFVQLRGAPKLLRQASAVRWFSEDLQSSIVKKDGKQLFMVRQVCYFESLLPTPSQGHFWNSSEVFKNCA